jgi:hypothetical protein
MKAIINHQPLLTCEKELPGLSYSRLYSFLLGQFTLVRKKLLSLLVLAGQALRATLASLIMASTVNSRVYTGYLLMAIFPIASCSHLLFSRVVRDPEWFYGHYYDLFLVLGPYLSIVVCLLGVYFWMPQTNKAKGLFLPIGFTVGKILWLMQVSSNQEFDQLPPLAFVIYGLLIGSLLPTVIDHLAWRKFHKHDGIIKRMDGLFQVPMSAEDKVKLLERNWSDYKNFHKVY